MNRRRLSLTLLFFFLAVPGAAMTQDACSSVLRDAEQSYREGRFEDALEVRDVCFESDVPNAERIRAWWGPCRIPEPTFAADVTREDVLE